MNSEWENVVSLDSIQHEESYFEVGLGVQLSLDWNVTARVPPRYTVCHIYSMIKSQPVTCIPFFTHAGAGYEMLTFVHVVLCYVLGCVCNIIYHHFSKI